MVKAQYKDGEVTYVNQYEDFLHKLIKDLEVDKKVLNLELQEIILKNEAKKEVIERVIGKIETYFILEKKTGRNNND